jgi:hypothetical protein
VAFLGLGRQMGVYMGWSGKENVRLCFQDLFTLSAKRRVCLRSVRLLNFHHNGRKGTRSKPSITTALCTQINSHARGSKGEGEEEEEKSLTKGILLHPVLINFWRPHSTSFFLVYLFSRRFIYDTGIISPCSHAKDQTKHFFWCAQFVVYLKLKINKQTNNILVNGQYV